MQKSIRSTRLRRAQSSRSGQEIKNQNDIAISFVNVSKCYTIYHEKPTLVEYLMKGRHEIFWALKDINLEIKKGEEVDINGLTIGD